MSRKKKVVSDVLSETPTLLEDSVEIQQSEEELETEITTVNELLSAEPASGCVLGILPKDPCMGCKFKQNSRACKSCVEYKRK